MYELIIIGAGPAGLTASIYASCYQISHFIVGKVLGGQLSLATTVLNYPGFEKIKGQQLVTEMIKQVKNLGGKIAEDEAVKISNIKNQRLKMGKDEFVIETRSGKKYQTKTLIVATGLERRKLNIPGENKFAGRGVFYCATCTPKFYERKKVAIVGGSNSAAQAALQIAPKAKKVYLIYRGEGLRAEPLLIENLKKLKNVEIIYKTNLIEIIGDGEKVIGAKLKGDKVSFKKIEELEIIDNDNGDLIGRLELQTVFIEIGGVPGAVLAASLGVKIDEKGYIITDKDLMTNIKGVFAAGDIVSGQNLQQIVTANALGCRAATSVYFYLTCQKAPVLWGKAKIKR